MPGQDCDDLILGLLLGAVRRDFLRRRGVGQSSSEVPGSSYSRTLRLNAARLEAWDETLPLEQQPAAFVERHRDLDTRLSEMQVRCEAHLQSPTSTLSSTRS